MYTDTDERFQGLRERRALRARQVAQDDVNEHVEPSPFVAVGFMLIDVTESARHAGRY
jgi:hypothetical protein